MARVAPLSASEEVMFRALMRLVITLPRTLGDDLFHACQIAGNEYTTLVHLSEAPNRELGVSDLAANVALSVSRMSRLLDDLQSRELIVKRRNTTDGRGSIACLTRQGLAALRSAYPKHLADVRRLVMDHVDEADLAAAARVLDAVAKSVDRAETRRAK